MFWLKAFKDTLPWTHYPGHTIYCDFMTIMIFEITVSDIVSLIS